MIRPPPRSTLFPYTTLFRSVPHDLGDLVDVAALQLLDVVLEPPRPVGGHARFLLAKDGEHFFDLFVVDHVAQADLLGVVGRHHEREVAVREAQHQVVALLAERFLLLALLDRGGAVVRVDDLVADVERHGSPRAKKTCGGVQGYQAAGRSLMRAHQSNARVPMTEPSAEETTSPSTRVATLRDVTEHRMLETTQLLGALPPDALESLRSASTVRDVNRNEVLFNRGDRAT